VPANVPVSMNGQESPNNRDRPPVAGAYKTEIALIVKAPPPPTVAKVPTQPALAPHIR